MLGRESPVDETFGSRAVPAQPLAPIAAHVCFATHVVRWVRERQHYAFQGEQALPDGTSVILTYCVDALSELLPIPAGMGRIGRSAPPTRASYGVAQRSCRAGRDPDIGLSVSAAYTGV